jgi:hypothetical protein
MHFSGSLEYQFVVASSRKMMSDLVRVASSPPAEAMIFGWWCGSVSWRPGC